MRREIRVLHVDDEPSLVELSKTFLERVNDRLRVETATGVLEGKELLDDDIDCVVSDFDMPGANGLEFLSTVRASYPSLPFILFTGKGSEEIASKAISAGVTDYLQKEHGTDQYTVLANRIENAVEQHRSKLALERSQQRLDLFFEHSPLGVIEWDSEIRIRRVNEAATDIVGYSERELVGDSWQSIVSADERTRFESNMTALLEGHSSGRELFKIRRKDGTIRNCEWNDHLVMGDGGELSRVFSQIQDVTERYENRRRLEALIDNLPGMVYQHRDDDEWTLELIRGSCEALTGYTAEELLENVEIAERLIHPDDRDWVRRQTDASKAEGEDFDLIYRIIDKDGTVRRVWERGGMIVTPDGDSLHEGLLIDITDLDVGTLEE